MARQMKDSGVDWIGEIPEAWSCSRVGRHYNIILGKMLCSTPCNDSYTYEPYYCAADVHFEGISKARKKMWFSEEEKNTLLVTTGDLLVTEGGMGGCAIVQDATTHTYIQNSLMIVRGRENASEPYLCYWLESLIKQSYLDYICNKVTIIHFTKEKLSGVPLPLPPEAEQQNIISYLDGKISLISKALEQTRATIEEYKKLKQAIITEAVTKGVRGPRPMKPSGVEWIGDIPEEWSKDKIGRVCNLIGSGTTPKFDRFDLSSADIPWIQSGDLSSAHLHNVKTYVTRDIIAAHSALKVYEPPFIAVAMYGASIGNTSISSFSACVNQACCVLTPDTFNLSYLYYIIMACKPYFMYQGEGGGQPNISQEKIKQTWIPVPNPIEQQEIAAYLDTKCAEIDRIIEKKEQLIEELGSYKKSLIYEYVTGKKEVTA